jgi:uncharacterized protein (TIGR02598 family)
VNCLKLKTTARTRAGFSLIEVSIAMAVAAVGLIAIIGLLPPGIQSSRDAADNTIAASVVQDVFSTIRAASFTDVDLNTPFGFTGPGASTGPYNLQNAYPATPNPVKAYFDLSGGPVPDPAATPQDCYYKVVVSFQPQNPPNPAVLSVVTATVSWPAKPGMTKFLSTASFVTQVAWY